MINPVFEGSSTLSIMAFGKATLSIVVLLATLSITALCIKCFYAKYTVLKRFAECCFAKCHYVE
jgi:hypothetical protein